METGVDPRLNTHTVSYNNNFYNSVHDMSWQDMTTVCSDELQKLKKEDPRYSGEL